MTTVQLLRVVFILWRVGGFYNYKHSCWRIPTCSFFFFIFSADWLQGFKKSWFCSFFLIGRPGREARGVCFSLIWCSSPEIRRFRLYLDYFRNLNGGSVCRQVWWKSRDTTETMWKTTCPGARNCEKCRLVPSECSSWLLKPLETHRLCKSELLAAFVLL